MEADGVARTADTDPDARVRAGPKPRPELLYIVGHHRSGGTVLGAILASAPSVFFAGELYRFPDPIWSSGDRARGCSCGAAVLDCPLWSEVRRRAESEGLPDRLRVGQSRYERWSALPRTLVALPQRDRGLQAHAAAMARFLEIIADCSGARVVVEYGASAARARAYRAAIPLGLKVRFVHMVRDGRGFLVSELGTTHDPEAPGAWIRHPLVVVGRWAWMNLAAVVLCGPDGPRYLRLRYEELLRDPRAALSRVGRFADLDLSGVTRRIEAGAPIPMRHIAAGNRARLRGTFVLDREPPHTPPLPWAARALFWTMAGWVAGLLGYHPRVRYRRAQRGPPDPAALGATGAYAVTDS